MGQPHAHLLPAVLAAVAQFCCCIHDANAILFACTIMHIMPALMSETIRSLINEAATAAAAAGGGVLLGSSDGGGSGSGSSSSSSSSSSSRYHVGILAICSGMWGCAHFLRVFKDLLGFARRLSRTQNCTTCHISKIQVGLLVHKQNPHPHRIQLPTERCIPTNSLQASQGVSAAHWVWCSCGYTFPKSRCR